MDGTCLLLKKIMKEVQYSVVLSDGLMTLYVLWLIVTDTAHWLSGVIFGVTPWGLWLILRANKLFHLCIIHRMMIVHTFLVYLCCVYQAYFGFGELLYPMRWTMLLIGVGLNAQLAYKRRWVRCEKTNLCEN